jgi:hypothetical protein
MGEAMSSAVLGQGEMKSTALGVLRGLSPFASRKATIAACERLRNSQDRTGIGIIGSDIANGRCSTANTAVPAEFAGKLAAERFIGNAGRNSPYPSYRVRAAWRKKPSMQIAFPLLL